MCGIVGFTWNNPELIEQLLNPMKHRGPDDTGTFCDDKISFGQNRLSILDLSIAGHQPMFYSPSSGAFSDRFHQNFGNGACNGIVYNGEMYNFPELKQELSAKGYVFATSCDTEVVLASYLEWGVDCLQHFNGMFAFAIYDITAKKIFLARDRSGEKPLFFLETAEGFAFGSELKSLFPLISKKEIDRKWLNEFLIFGFAVTENTVINGINHLKPAHYMVYDLNLKKIEINKPYWSSNFKKIDITFKDAKIRLRELVADAVKRRLLSDVPVGAFLSGGVDSSIIVSEMRKHVADLKTFSIGFDYEEFNESSWAKIVAQKFNTDHYEIKFTSTNVREAIEDLSFFYDEPFGDSSMVPTYFVAKVAKQHVTVCLSGTGADELFGGYSRFVESKQLSQMLKLPKIAKSVIFHTYKNFGGQIDKAYKLKELLNCSEDYELYLKLFSDLFRNKEDFPVDFDQVRHLRSLMNEPDPLSSKLNFEQLIYLPYDLLVKEDRACMANSLEGRIPFLDPKIIEFANSLPSEFKINKGITKFILKDAYNEIIPKENLYRSKKGFGMPLSEYLKKELKDYASEIIFDKAVYPFYDKKIVVNLWDKHQKGMNDYSSFFWKIIVFNKWYERWM